MTLFENKNPLVSVCILTYNQQNTIAETIDSVLKQECDFEYEIIIGEDGSTDLTLPICRSYEALHPGVVKIITSKENMGLMRNFKNVTKMIRGKYFAGCGGDDFWHDPHKLQLQVEFMERNLNYGMVHSGCKYIYENNGITKEYVPEHKERDNIFESILTGAYGNIIASTAFIRTSIFHENVYFDEYLTNGYLMEDLPMWLDISFNSGIGYIAKPLVTYRVSDESVSQSKNREKMLIFLKSRWKVQFDYAFKYKVQNSVLNSIKKNKNDICIENAFHMSNFKESLFWIKHLEYKNLFINWSYRNFVLLILIFLNIKYKQVKWLKDFWQYDLLRLCKFRFTLAK